MVVNTSKLWSIGIKIASFAQKLTKNRPAAGSFATRPPIAFLDPRLW